jgi:hypothetical protein
MNEERGAALRLLYQVKLALEKTDPLDQKTMTNLKPDILNKKMQETFNLKTTLPTTSNLNTVNGLTKLAPIER